MRLTLSAPLTLTTAAPPTLEFAGPRGERLRVSVLDDDLVRVQHLPEGRLRLDRTWLVAGDGGDVPLHGRRRDDLRPFPCPSFDLQMSAEAVRVRTRALQFEVLPEEGRLWWADAGGQAFAADLRGRAYAYDRGGRAVFHYLERRRGEHYYGFGEKTGPLDKSGRRLRMHNVDALGYDARSSDPLYKHWPFYITFIPEMQIAYGLFYDNLADCVFDLGQEINAIWGDYRYYQADDGDLDYYLIYGPSLAAVVEKFARLTGRPALPPRWTLGFLGSTMYYTELPDAQAQLGQFIAQCQEHDIPCDLFHLSSGYTTDAHGRRNVFTWNAAKIPDPRRLVEDFHRAGIRLSANVKPHLLTTHPDYAEAAARGLFVRAAESDAPEHSHSWSGGLYESAAASYLDFTYPPAYDWWKARARAALLDYGIDGLWNDNNEFDLWDDSARCDGFGQTIPLALARPLLTLLMARASYEALLEARPNDRPYLISRAGCPGVQRYAQTWSGDNRTGWETLRYNLPMGLGASLSGMANTSHDVGGFFGGPPDPELFLRWIQAGVFHPRFTIHSVGLTHATEPWMYPDLLPLVREWFAFRYRLIPYLYSLLFQAAQTGAPILRPLVYHFPHDPRTPTESFDFMLGPNLLVAPVLEAGARSRPVYLPQGTDWCDYATGAWYAGGGSLVADAPLARIPLFVPAGGLLPMGKPMRCVGAEPDDVRQVYVFPHPRHGIGRFVLIEDDGQTLAYQRGGYAEVILEVEASPQTIALRAEVRGDYRLPYRHLDFILPPGERRRASAAGADLWSDDAGRRHVRVQLPSA